LKNKIFLLGEAYGEQEERWQMPFVGPAGYFLNQMLEDVGIKREECYVTNVFNLRPQPTNDIRNLCGSKAEGLPGREPLSSGKYIRAEFAGELARLSHEVADTKPNLIVALGGTAAWACFGRSAISKSRGAVAPSVWGPKAIATYHPSAVLRDYSLRAVTVADLAKARRECGYPEIRRPRRTILAEPDLGEIEAFYNQYVAPAPRMAVDIETIHNKYITMIGFAPRTDLAIVIHFYDPRKPDNVYWQSPDDERTAWRWVERYCLSPPEKVFQNGLYDLHFLRRRYRIAVRNCAHDTMLLHHALQPESEKSLGFLGSVYTEEASWKLMRRQQTDHAGLK
jgi:uracil-DNA glycosylase